MNASEIMTMIRCKRDRLLWWIIRSPRQIKWKILSKLKLDNGSLYHLTDYLGPYSLKDFLHSVNTEADDVHQVESDETAQSPSWVLHSLRKGREAGMFWSRSLDLPPVDHWEGQVEAAHHLGPGTLGKRLLNTSLWHGMRHVKRNNMASQGR